MKRDRRNEKMKRKMFGRVILVMVPFWLLGIVFAGHAAPVAQSINLITNPAGMGLYTIAVAQGQLIARKTGLQIIVQPSQGPKVIPYILESGDGQVATLSVNNTFWAYKGISEYKKPYKFLRVLQAGNENYFAIITKDKSGIKTIPDLKGKRVTYSVTSYMTQLVMETELLAYGLNPTKDITVVKTEDNSTALRDLDQGRTDAAACGLGGSKMVELSRKTKIVVLPFDPSKIAFVQKEMVMFPAITPDNLSGVDPGLNVIATPNLLIGRADLSDGVAYQMVKALVENYNELKAVNPVLADWKPEVSVRELPVPYHPGAIKYYKEKGFWSSKMDQLQQKLLAEK
jgi:TRAP transporter TAXI family solute receptor